MQAFSACEKNAILILIFMHNIFNVCDTEIDGPNHNLYFRQCTRPSADIIGKKWATGNQNLIVNIISRYLYASDKNTSQQ